MSDKYENMLSLTSYQGYANLHYSEIPSHPSQKTVKRTWTKGNSQVLLTECDLVQPLEAFLWSVLRKLKLGLLCDWTTMSQRYCSIKCLLHHSSKWLS